MRRSVLLLIAGGLVAGGIAGTGTATHHAADPGVDLDQIRKQLDVELPLTPGMRWFVNEKTQSVEVSLPERSTESAFSRVQSVTAKYGNAVTYTRHPYGVGNAEMNGGVFIGSPGAPGGYVKVCSLGFNMINHSTGLYYAATAGHCTYDGTVGAIAENWYTNPAYSVYLGNEVSTRLGGTDGFDFAIIRYQNANLSHPGTVHNYKFNQDYDITGSGYADDGDYVCKSGRTTGTTCGYVIYSCVGHDYWADGLERRLVCGYETTLCTAGGDSGGPIWHGSQAVAIHTTSNGGWNGDWSRDNACGANHRAWHQKAPYIEFTYGHSIF
jgi:streptogrisin D